MKQILNQPYNRQSFIENMLLPTVQGRVDDLKIYDSSGAESLALTDSERQYAKSAIKYGEFTTRDETAREVGLYEVILKDDKRVERSRVGIAALVKKHIIGNDAVLVNFAYENPENRPWRFSFIAHDAVFAAGEMKQTATNPKRYTYVFGEPEETYRTALERFDTLGREKDITMASLKNAFGVEALSKAFFDEYRDTHYAGFVDYLTNSNFKQSVFNADEKEIRDFVKKLLGRIVFLYFIQKKGWLGANNEDYQDGDKNFMSHFYQKAKANETFYPNWLSKLFFDTLNTRRPDDAFEMPGGTVVKIPYLNGGLFEKESDRYDFLTFPPGLFRELFAFFDSYNFTIYEDSPEEHTVAVDPEMLGHIFENLLEDNKDKGAFYTPKEIVHYMTQASLTEYLHTQIPEINRDKLEAFVKNKAPECEENELSETHKKQIDQKLDAVKICDPAIGSGAFPMGLLQEIFGLKERIAHEFGYSVWSPARVKEHIIQNSIYGVDIEKGAVDIARLRFWLSLIVDEEKPKPLPNLDYKIMQGNSLVSKFVPCQRHPLGKDSLGEAEIVEIDWSTDDASAGFFGQEFVIERTRLLKAISEKQKEFFTANTANKPKLAKEIRKLKLEILAMQLEVMIATKGAKEDKNALKKPSKKQLEKYLETEGWQRTLSKINQLKLNDKPFKHFDWKLDFPEVLNPLAVANTGFDIVIGNPPYLRVQGIRDNDSAYADELIKKFKAATGSFDLYAVFLENAMTLINSSGVVNFIMPVKWTNAAFGSGLREVVTKTDSAYKIINFGAYQVFNASTYTGLQWFKANSDHLKYYELDRDILSADGLSKYLSGIKSESRIPKDKLGKDSWVLSSREVTAILDKLGKHPRRMSDIFEKIFQGLATSKDNVYFLYNCKENGNHVTGFSKQLDSEVKVEKDFVKPLLKGDDVHRYEPIETNKVVLFPYKLSEETVQLYTEKELKNEFPLAYNYLKKCEDVLRDREKGRFNIDGEWFQYGRKQGILFAEKEKLLAPEISLGGNFTYDQNGDFYSTTKIYGYIKKEAIKEGYKFWLGLLNSRLFWFFIQQTGYVLRGGYFTFKTNYIHPFPVPAEFSISHTERVVDLVTEILTLKKENPKTDTSDLEEEIDELVFDLYELTEEERKIILQA